MLRKLAAATICSALGTSAYASSIGFDITVSNLSFGGSVTNVPLMTLQNTSSSADITSFSFTIGNTAYNYDAIYFFSDPGNMSLILGDMFDGNQSTNPTRVDVGQIDFTSFGPSTSYNWRVDVDIDNRDTVEDYRDVLFNNGVAPNAAFTATFSTGHTLSVTATDGNPQGTSFTFSTAQDLNVTAVPLPAGVPLALSGLGAFALLRRRKR